MSKLEKLIAEYCPDGVPFRKISDCCTIEKGRTPIQKAIPGEYPLVVTTSERKSSNVFQFEKPGVCIPLVSSRGHGVACLNEVYYQEGKYAVGNILCCVIPRNEKELSAKFLHAFLNYAKDYLLVPQMKGGANVSLSIDAIARVKVPVPPLPVQDKIVFILNRFKGLLSTLIAEQEARKKQYEYYKNMCIDNNTVFSTIKEITSDRFWLMPATPQFINNGIPYITSKNIRNGRIDFSDAKYISFEDYSIISKNRSIQKNDLLITMIGTIGEIALVDDNIQFYGQNVYLLRFDEKKCLKKYAYYYLSSERVKKALISKRNASSQGYIKAGSIDDLIIPLPSINIQEQIVSILDRFDAFNNDISSGLPAEIEARQKQYSYYCNKLLTFKEKEA